MELFRITHRKWADSLSGSGRAGRWNSNQINVIYTSSSRSLSCLENVVHRKGIELQVMFSIMNIYVPDEASTENLLIHELPDNWNKADDTYYKMCQPFGDRWMSKNQSLLYKVPSAIVKNEFNFLINPYHPEFEKVKILGNEPFYFDPRIK